VSVSISFCNLFKNFLKVLSSHKDLHLQTAFSVVDDKMAVMSDGHAKENFFLLLQNIETKLVVKQMILVVSKPAFSFWST